MIDGRQKRVENRPAPKKVPHSAQHLWELRRKVLFFAEKSASHASCFVQVQEPKTTLAVPPAPGTWEGVGVPHSTVHVPHALFVLSSYCDPSLVVALITFEECCVGPNKHYYTLTRSCLQIRGIRSQYKNSSGTVYAER